MWDDILIYGASLLAVVAFMIYFSVCSMARSPEPVLRPELATKINASVPADTALLLQNNGFNFVAAYGFHLVWFGIWTQKEGRSPIRYYCFAGTTNSRAEEFITVFSDDASLTTTRTRSAFVFPRPFGAFMQAFPKAPISQLWDSHQRGEQYLVSEVAIPVKDCRLSYVERLKQGVVTQTAHIRSLPLWPLRGVYWFFIKRFLMHNRPIWAQDIRRTYGTSPDRLR
jgi:hypothetical protein